MKYRKGYKYQLFYTENIQTDIIPDIYIETEYIELTIKGLLTVKEGYAWDGASGPTIDTKSSMRASLIHDAFYQLFREEKLGLHYRPEVDRLFCQICKEDGMWPWRANLWYFMVHKFALSASVPENDKEIIEAP